MHPFPLAYKAASRFRRRLLPPTSLKRADAFISLSTALAKTVNWRISAVPFTEESLLTIFFQSVPTLFEGWGTPVGLSENSMRRAGAASFSRMLPDFRSDSAVCRAGHEVGL